MVVMTDRLPFRTRLDVDYDECIEPDNDDFDISEGDEAEDRFWAFERDPLGSVYGAPQTPGRYAWSILVRDVETGASATATASVDVQ